MQRVNIINILAQLLSALFKTEKIFVCQLKKLRKSDFYTVEQRQSSVGLMKC